LPFIADGVSETWFILDSGPGEPALNMALDEALLQSAHQIAQPVLRFYRWTQPAASFGYFQRIAHVERATHLRPLVRRPTAGGIVPHDADWTYSVLLPAPLEWHQLRAEQSYQRMHEWIRRAFGTLGVETELARECRRPAPGQCFAGYETHDLLWRGRKIAGAAQRRTRSALLIQGSVQPPPLGLDRKAWQQAMTEALPVEWQDWRPDEAVVQRCQELVEVKHGRKTYQRKR
jgi:lipoate-protein ligase A